MPPLVRRYLKTAVAFLIFGVGLGVYMLARRELAGIWPTPWWTSAHTHAILVGFVMMMILGRRAVDVSPPGEGRPPFRPAAGGGCVLVLTLGTAARVAGELLRPIDADRGLRWTVVAGGGAQALGLVLFFWTMWTRIRGRVEG